MNDNLVSIIIASQLHRNPDKTIIKRSLLFIEITAGNTRQPRKNFFHWLN